MALLPSIAGLSAGFPASSVRNCRPLAGGIGNTRRLGLVYGVLAVMRVPPLGSFAD
jgi:hypothetical protein